MQTDWLRIVEIVVVFGFTLTALFLMRVLWVLALTLEGMRSQLSREAEQKKEIALLKRVAGLPSE